MAQQTSVSIACRHSSRRKVKTGCQTCKRRKVKCDENWPACHRCRATSRVCEGYGIWGGGSQACDRRDHASTKRDATVRQSSEKTMQIMSISSIPLIALPVKEKDNYEWFVRRSLIKLPGLFESQQSTELLLQATISEPAIRHAMLVLSSTHREEVRGLDYSSEGPHDEQTLFTMAQYSKALTHLQRSIPDYSSSSVRTTFFTCMLFIGADFLRGHYTSGLLHLESGLKLLLEDHDRIQTRGDLSTFAHGWIITTTMRQFVQAKLLGQLPGIPCRRVLGLVTQSPCERFRSIHHARRSLEYIMLRTFDVQERLSLLPIEMADLNIALIGYHHETQLELENWFKAFERTVRNLPPTSGLRDRFAYNLLRLYYYLTTILVGTCLNAEDESRFDHYNHVFLKILLHCIETYELIFPNGTRNPKAYHDPEPTSPNSIADIGWIAPLYFTALKCRNPRIRHHAIKLLRSSLHREGIWSAALVAAVTSKIAEMEEGDFYRSQGIDCSFAIVDIPSKDDLDVPNLPVTSRCSAINIVLPDDRAGKLLLKCNRYTSDGRIEWISGEYDLRTCLWTDRIWTS